MKPRTALRLAALCIAGCLAHPVPAQLVAVEPGEAGPDFPVQGEYLGESDPPSGTASRLGAQVVAEGEGHFRAVFFPGGLPGEGGDGAARFEAEAARTGGGIAIAGGSFRGIISGDSLSGEDSLGTHFTLRKHSRLSPSLGLPPPAQATVLFDGTGLSAWENASVDDRGFFAPLEIVSTSRKRLANFSMHMEFRVPFMPSALGEGRGNSGLQFLDGKNFIAELQILDSFGNPPRQDECGGLEVIAPPDLVASLPPLTWETFDIQLTTPSPAVPDSLAQGRITVWHNGILIHPGRAVKPLSAEVTLALQKFQGPVVFRNMWLIEGNDHYPFFPAGALHPRALKAKTVSGRKGMTWKGGASAPASPEITDGERGYRTNGVRIR